MLLGTHQGGVKPAHLGAYLDEFAQIRTRVLNNDLANEFHRWYPGFTHTPDHENIAA